MSTDFGRSILVLAPHPDDEVVACCAAIGRAQSQGASVFVLYLTHGCLAEQTRWSWDRPRHEALVARRREEGERVAIALKLKTAGWSSRPARHLWRDLGSAHAQVSAAVAAHGIDQIWAPAYEGGNPDHDAANALASVFQHAPARLSVLEFALYNFNGAAVRSQSFPHPNGAETVLNLTPAEKAEKRRRLALYDSERANLRAIASDRECFRPMAAYDYGAPPHEGRLWYARFQWIPFRHPRVDFTQPSEVSMAITQFLRSAAPIEA